MDTKGNAIFPHYDEEGTCGYEIKNKGFTGFSAGGDKGLWVSRCFAGDESLVIAESAIDALSFHALHKWKTARYVSPPAVGRRKPEPCFPAVVLIHPCIRKQGLE